MRLAEFQVICARSDPRTALIFQRPFADVYPHIAIMGHELATKVVRYRGATDPSTRKGHSGAAEKNVWTSVQLEDTLGDQTERSGSITAVGAAPSEDAAESPFLAIFDSCLETGAWLVVEGLADVAFQEWRHVGTVLAQLLPNAKHHLRKQFRLFSFIDDQSSNPNLWSFAPGIFCQFALVVDPHGKVHSRSDVSPIFHGDCTVDTIGDVLTTLANNSEAGNSGGRDLEDVASVRQRLVAALEARPPATDPDYVDEVLCSLREHLVERQILLLENVDDEVERQLQAVMQENELAVRKAEESSFAPSNPAELSGMRKNPDKERQRLKQEETKRIESDRDWVYRSTLEWAIDQCPDAEAVSLCQIPAEELLADTVAWTNSVEICYFASWDGGCEVLMKEPNATYNPGRYSRAVAAFNKEASRHSALRHPQVLQLYGVSNHRMVLEYGIGTLDQALLRARGETRRWSQMMFLNLARQVTRGMLFCSQKIVHRALACRSVVETSPGQFKVAQFGSAIPLVTLEAKEGCVPIRCCSPEALLGVFSEKSDVWAFGVLVWEAVQYCAVQPYADHIQPATAIAAGETLKQPLGVSDALFDLLIAPCLAADPDARPTFRDLLDAVESAMRLWDKDALEGLVPLPAERMSFEAFNAQRLELLRAGK
jgi:hypothetical protein